MLKLSPSLRLPQVIFFIVMIYGGTDWNCILSHESKPYQSAIIVLVAHYGACCALQSVYPRSCRLSSAGSCKTLQRIFKPGNAFQGINLVKVVRTFLLVKCSESETGPVISFVLFTLWAIRKTDQQNGLCHASQS